MIGQIIAPIASMLYDIKDSIEAKEVPNLKANVVEIALVVSDDLPQDLVTQYCETLEVAYARVLRSCIEIVTRHRGNSNTKSIFKSIPILNNSDTVRIDTELGVLSSVSDKLFAKKEGESGGKAVSFFLEELNKMINDIESHIPGLEDLSQIDQRGGMPTFIEVIIPVSQPGGGKIIEKTISLGVSVKPKIVKAEEILSFFIKQNKKILEQTPAEKIRRQKLTMRGLFTKRRIEEAIDLTPLENRTLNNMLEASKDINKPFICILMSQYVKDILLDAKIDIEKPNILRHIYSKFPVIGISIYNVSSDTIKYSLLQDTSFTEKTAASFNTDVSVMQKTLAEGLRVKNYLS